MKWSCIGAIGLAVATYPGAKSSADEQRDPVAAGTYEILLGGKRIGEERFSIFEEKKTLIVESTTTLYWPEPVRQEYRHEIVSSFQTKKVSFIVTRGGLTTTATLEPHRDDWRLEIQGQGGKKTRQDLGRRSDAEVDFGSSLFKSFVLKRLSLGPGEERNAEVVALRLPDCVGERGLQTYRRLEDQQTETKLAKTIQAFLYEQVGSESTHRLWVGPSGFVLRAQFESPAGVFVAELVRLESKWSFTPPR